MQIILNLNLLYKYAPIKTMRSMKSSLHLPSLTLKIASKIYWLPTIKQRKFLKIQKLVVIKIRRKYKK